MTNEDEVAFNQLPGAFDRLTTALHGNAKRRRVAGLVVATFIALGFGIIVDGRNQAHDNQKHIDCVVGIVIRQDPPKCRGVKDQLIRDGIVPSGFPNTTTTRSTTP